MIKNYLKTALRIMLRQKGYSAINITGLSIGIAATLIIIVYISDELSFDKFHKDASLIYRINCAVRVQGTQTDMAVSPSPVAETIQKEIPDIAEVVRFGMWRTMPMNVGDKSFTEKYVLVADSNFFKFFTFQVVQGDVNTFLQGPDKIVITETVARRYFGNENPIGKIMLRGSEKSASEVTGVVKDAPLNSHIPFDIILSSDSWDYMKNDNQWASNNIYTYIKLNPNGNINKVRKQLNEIADQKINADLERILGISIKQFRDKGDDIGLQLRPLLDIHLKSSLDMELLPNGNILYLYIFGAIALFIILIACINFMNLSTARSANRAKEVGVRKTIGAMRERLVFQFLSESILYSVISMILAIGIIGTSINAFNVLSGKELSVSFLYQPIVIAGLIIFTLLIGLIAGSYPAFYLTAFKPTDVLKGKIRSGFKNSGLRNGLVVFQFIISIALIFGSLVVYRQLQYMQQKNLGFDKENVISLLHTMSLGNQAKAFKNELIANPIFKGASFCNSLPPYVTSNSAFRKAGSEQDYLLYEYQVDHDHLETMGYTMTQGRFFSREFKSDTAAVILNEAAFKQMGFKNLDEAEVISYQGTGPHKLKVIGVLKDINFRSLKDNVMPMLLELTPEPGYEMAIRFAPGNKQEQLATLESIWKKHTTGAPFEYTFIDQNFDLLFRAEQRMGQIIVVFTALAIGIACLGLFGLAAYTAEQRAKEISIRKVMGASVSQMVVLMSRDFTLLVVISFIIATPLAWYLTDSWLQGFANRIDIDFSIVILSGFISFFIALVTISFQSIRAARENPVRAMRSE